MVLRHFPPLGWRTFGAHLKRQTSWNLELGAVAGIPIRIHFTFLALLVWVAISAASSLDSAIEELFFVIALFACVLLHELGHAITARFFKIKTRDITLYPFGGIAALAREPHSLPELVIAAAGPIVNLVLAIACVPFIEISFSAAEASPMTLVERLFLANIALGLFNLVPALPMDGGRMLRALLTLGDFKNATLLCSRLSQLICVVMGIFAIALEQPILLVIAFLIFFAAIQEKVRFEAKRAVVGLTVGDAMVPAARLEAIDHGTLIASAARTILTSSQTVFPIVVGKNLLGLITRDELLQAAVANERGYIGNIMHRDIPSVDRDAPLARAFEVLELTGSQALVVKHDDDYQGLILRDRLYEYLVLTNMQSNQPDSDDAEWFRQS